MRDFVRQLLGKRGSAERHAAVNQPPMPLSPVQQLDRLAPLKSATESRAPSALDAKLSFVCREAVLDRAERIAGYEFALHRKLHYRFAAERAMVRRVYDDLLLRSLGSMELGELLGHRMAFVDIAAESFANLQLEALPRDNTILMLHPRSEAVADESEYAAWIDVARQAGFRIGWYHTAAGPIAPDVLALVDFLQVRSGDFDGLQLVEIVRWATKARGANANRLQFVASGVTTLDEFRLCFQAGYDYFQGPFVNNREQWHPPKSEVDRMRVIRILNEFQAGAETGQLGALIRQDAVLSYKLLRYINSPAMGLAKQIAHIEQGLALLGRGPFYRWLSLLLFDFKGAGFAERVLFEQALVRARLMEQIAVHSECSGLNPDHLFMVGLFSLLDQMLQMPTIAVLEKISVPEDVRKALIERSGPLAPFLGLSLICETGDPDEMALLASACRVNLATVNVELMRAVSWAQNVATLGG
ncbi:MAG: HDOD domain-containing protein [Burkholderiaceae bacterium]|jgi:EAL and modified HD-GYP domain-containing signal transduction protein